MDEINYRYWFVHFAYNTLNRKNGEYYNKMNKVFSVYGIREENITWLDYYLDSKDECIRNINNSDIIYFTGGLPDKLYERLTEFDLVKTLENFKKIIIGSSAGAVIQFRNFHLTPDIDYKKFNIYKGLNILNEFGIEVHFKNSFKQRRSLKKVKKIYDKKYYTIPDDSCIIINNGKINLIKNSKEYKF